jgi:hypothetical protein
MGELLRLYVVQSAKKIFIEEKLLKAKVWGLEAEGLAMAP